MPDENKGWFSAQITLGDVLKVLGLVVGLTTAALKAQSSWTTTQNTIQRQGERIEELTRKVDRLQDTLDKLVFRERRRSGTVGPVESFDDTETGP